MIVERSKVSLLPLDCWTVEKQPGAAGMSQFHQLRHCSRDCLRTLS